MDTKEVHEAIREYGAAAVLGAGGALAWSRGWWRRRVKRQRRNKAEAVALRKLLDAARYNLFLISQPDAPVDATSHEARVWELRTEIDNAREELWVSNGNTSKRRERDG